MLKRYRSVVCWRVSARRKREPAPVLSDSLPVQAQAADGKREVRAREENFILMVDEDGKPGGTVDC